MWWNLSFIPFSGLHDMSTRLHSQMYTVANVPACKSKHTIALGTGFSNQFYIQWTLKKYIYAILPWCNAIPVSNNIFGDGEADTRHTHRKKKTFLLLISLCLVFLCLSLSVSAFHSKSLSLIHSFTFSGIYVLLSPTFVFCQSNSIFCTLIYSPSLFLFTVFFLSVRGNRLFERFAGRCYSLVEVC